MVLHITNDYAGSTVYKNLVGALDDLGVEQIVYTPVKENQSIGGNEIPLKTPSSKIIYSNILNKSFDKLFYRLKIRKIMKDLEKKVDVSKIHYIHAHTWYSDGGVAYLLHKRHNIPYLITVRNSDLNVFYKYLFNERRFGRIIMRNAEHVVLVSAAHKKRVENLSALRNVALKDKLRVVPNGVDRFWIENSIEEGRALRLNKTVNILFVGKFSSEKNVPRLLKAIIALKKRHELKIKLHIVGGGGKYAKQVKALINAHPSTFEFYGKVYDKEKLLSIYKSCDIFAMPSKRETFGLVYVEAMLQGLPILYTRREGIDGFYEENIGESVWKRADAEEIQEKLHILIQTYKHYQIPIEKIKRNHDWKSIAKVYQNIYC